MDLYTISREKRASSISKFPKQLRNQFVHDPRESLAYEWDNCRLLHPSSEILSLIRYSLFFSPSGSSSWYEIFLTEWNSDSQFLRFEIFLLPDLQSRARMAPITVTRQQRARLQIQRIKQNGSWCRHQSHRVLSKQRETRNNERDQSCQIISSIPTHLCQPTQTSVLQLKQN